MKGPAKMIDLAERHLEYVIRGRDVVLGVG
jgi:hypothetical protein